MKHAIAVIDDILCRVGYTGDLAILIDPDAPPVVQPYTARIFLEPKPRDPQAPLEPPERKGVGKVTFGVFRPLNFPQRPIPFHIDIDITAPLRRAWDSVTGEPAAWLRGLFPSIRSEFLVFASIQVTPAVAGRRIALSVMADIINRHLAPGGIVLLNPYPLEYLMSSERADATPEEKQRGVSALKRHYSRIGLQAIETEPDLMVLQRPSKPIQAPHAEIRFPRDQFQHLPDVYAYDGRY